MGSKAKTVGGLSQGPHQEQVWQDREQEAECSGQNEHMDDCREEGTRCLEDQGLRCRQEGHAPLPEGKGVPAVSAARCRAAAGEWLRRAGMRHQLQLWGFLRLSSG